MRPSTLLPVPNNRPAAPPSVCALTEEAMSALSEIAAGLEERGADALSEIELRTLIWARCSLAALYGIRVDDTLKDVDTADLGRILATDGPPVGYNRAMTDFARRRP